MRRGVALPCSPSCRRLPALAVAEKSSRPVGEPSRAVASQQIRGRKPDHGGHEAARGMLRLDDGGRLDRWEKRKEGGRDR